jgi:hypothetical protein
MYNTYVQQAECRGIIHREEACGRDELASVRIVEKRPNRKWFHGSLDKKENGR